MKIMYKISLTELKMQQWTYGSKNEKIPQHKGIDIFGVIVRYD